MDMVSHGEKQVAENRTKSAQYLLRMPPGLRERIKAYADKHGRTLNEEIVRLLEREFPEPWPLHNQITSLVALSNALKETIGSDDLNVLGDTLLKTVQGVASGRVLGVDEKTRSAVASWLSEFQAQFNEVERDDFEAVLDDEEQLAYNRDGSTAKFVDPFEDEK